MPEITKGFNALLIKDKKLQHKFEIRVEIFSLGFYVLEFKDKQQINQITRGSYINTSNYLHNLRLRYKQMGCKIYPLDEVIKYTYDSQTLEFEAK